MPKLFRPPISLLLRTRANHTRNTRALRTHPLVARIATLVKVVVRAGLALALRAPRAHDVLVPVLGRALAPVAAEVALPLVRVVAVLAVLRGRAVAALENVLAIAVLGLAALGVLAVHAALGHGPELGSLEAVAVVEALGDSEGRQGLRAQARVGLEHGRV